MAELRGVLRAVVTSPIPTIAELPEHPPVTEPEPFDEEAPRWADYAPARDRPDRATRAVGRRSRRARLDADFAAFEERRAAVRARGEARLSAARTEHAQRIDDLVADAGRDDPDAAPELAAAVLAALPSLNDLVRGGDGVYRPDARELAIDVELPTSEVIPAEQRWKYVVNRRVVASESHVAITRLAIRNWSASSYSP
jgi:hypothetical protein